jgi:predicted ATPase/DNA-binding winged helix-turn-helix (wHTH) protein
MTELGLENRDTVTFGPFALDPRRRLLTRNGVPVELGARTLDTLIVLVSRSGEAVGKRELMARIWPDVTVEEGSLRFHIATLRKALGDGKTGVRYIATLAGRGYCFVAPVERTPAAVGDSAPSTTGFSHANLPPRLAQMVGRDEDVSRLFIRLTASRFVSIVGTGGVGKTTVAVALGHHMMESFDGAVLFVDLSILGRPELISTALASMLGLTVRSDDVMPNVLAYLREKRILLILDTCEHVIDGVSALAAKIFASAPHVHILATSREALQVDHEHVYRLDSLSCPPDDTGLTADSIHAFAATRLFVERAVASGARLQLSDSDAALVGAICRKLDGVALAIELAARRVEAYGLQQTAMLLDQRLALSWTGQRSAVPRQRTLQATLEWSFSLLTELERLVVLRLAIFVGHFTLDAALQVVSSDDLDQAHVLGAIDSLISKSMVAPRPIGAMMRYRLLDTTRAYALETSRDATEFAKLAARHAAYYARWLQHNGLDWSALRTGDERAPHFAGLGNARAALEWCFGPGGDSRVGIELAAAAVPVFLAMSLLPECNRWSRQALGLLDSTTRGTPAEMHLQAGLGISTMHLQGQTEAVRAALDRSVAIAVDRGDSRNQAGLLGALHMYLFRIGAFRTALECAQQCRAIARSVDDPAAATLSNSILGGSLHLLGDHVAAHAALEASLADRAHPHRASTVYLAYDGHRRTEIALARSLWLQGRPAQAAQLAHDVLASAQAKDQPESLVVVLAWGASVFLWTGDLDSAERHIQAIVAHSSSYSLGPLAAVGRGRQGELAILRGDAQRGVNSLRASLERMRAVRYNFLGTEFRLALVQGLAATGRRDLALAEVDAAIHAVGDDGDHQYMPELLRLKASLQDGHAAEDCLLRSLELSRGQGARGWELRAATDLGLMLEARNESTKAHAVLRPVFDQFGEGWETPDLTAAARLLARLT